MPGSKLSTWADTRARAAAIVEAVNMYEIAKPYLVQYLTGGLSDDRDLEICNYIVDQLDDFLKVSPFYPTTPEDMELGKKPADVYDIESAANALGVTKCCLWERLNKCEVQLPRGFKFERKWSLYSEDIEFLRQEKDRQKFLKIS